MYFANEAAESANCKFIGMLPKLPYDDEYLHLLLKKRGCRYFELRERVLRYTKTKIMQDYLTALLEPV